MMKKLILWTTTFCFTWVQSAQALTSSETAAFKTFLQESQLTQREVPLKEMLQKYGKDLPESVRVQLEALVKENPDYAMPKMDVKKISVGGEDQLEFTIHLPEGNLQMTTTKSSPEAITIVGSLYGNSIKETLLVSSVIDQSPQDIYNLRLALLRQKPSHTVVMPPDEVVRAMSSAQKLEYVKNLRGALVEMEKLQNFEKSQSHKNNSKSNESKSSWRQKIWEQIEAPAWSEEEISSSGPEPTPASKNSGGGLVGGKDPDSCIIAGNAGTWHVAGSSQFCRGTKEIYRTWKGHQQVQCNSFFYGDNSWVDFSSEQDRNNATSNCESGDPKFTKLAKKLDATKNINNDADFKEKFASTLNKFVQDADLAYKKSCTAVMTKNTPTNHPNEFQFNACLKLRARCDKIDELNTNSCTINGTSQVTETSQNFLFSALAADSVLKQKFEHYCSLQTPVPPPPPVAPIVEAKTTATAAPPPPPERRILKVSDSKSSTSSHGVSSDVDNKPSFLKSFGIPLLVGTLFLGFLFSGLRSSHKIERGYAAGASTQNPAVPSISNTNNTVPVTNPPNAQDHRAVQKSIGASQ